MTQQPAPKPSEKLEAFAAEHGIPALLDHLGLDGLGNEVVALEARVRELEDALREILDCTTATKDHPKKWHVAKGSGPRFRVGILTARALLDTEGDDGALLGPGETQGAA